MTHSRVFCLQEPVRICVWEKHRFPYAIDMVTLMIYIFYFEIGLFYFSNMVLSIFRMGRF